MSIPVYAKMILWAHVETECETVLYSKQFDKLLTNCFTTGSELTAEEEENGYGKTEFGQDAAIRPSVEEEAIFVQSYKSRARDLYLEHILDARSPGDHRVHVWS